MAHRTEGSPPERASGASHGSGPSPQQLDAGAAAVEVLERELTLLWQRERSMSRQVSGRVSGGTHVGMEPAAYGLLSVLQQEGPLRLTAIAAILEVGKPSLSRQVTVLEHLGLVRRETDPVDARAQMITLTDAGISRLEAVQHARTRAFHRLLAGWDINDLTALTDLVGQLNTISLAKDRLANYNLPETAFVHRLH